MSRPRQPTTACGRIRAIDSGAANKSVIASAGSSRKRKAKTPAWRIRQSIVTYVGLIPYVAFALFPLYIMLVTSLKSKQEINNLGASPFWATGRRGPGQAHAAENEEV